MNKVRWLIADMPGSLDELSVQLLKVPFDPTKEDTDGFRLEFVGRDRLLGQHIEKETYIHQFLLPNGVEYGEQRSIFTVTEFVVFANAALNLRLNDPPRKGSVFFNALMRALNYKFSVEYVEVDVLKWIAELEERFQECIVRALDCNRVQVADGITGRFAFRGMGDVRKEASKVLIGKSSSVESATCMVRYRNADYSFELYRSGTLKSTSELSSEITSIVGETLGHTVRSYREHASANRITATSEQPNNAGRLPSM
jgi:hypothetical protein